MKKKRSLIIAFAVIFSFTTGVVAKNVFDIIKAEVRTDFVVEIDGEEREFKNANGERVYPILHNGTTYLPLRAIGEIMEKDVYWYEADKRIELKDKKKAPTVTDADVIVESDPNAEKSKEHNKKDKMEKPVSDKEKNIISKEKAKEIALEKANFKLSDVTFIKAEFDTENGTYVYEIEFKKGNKEYSAEIKADDGKIIDWEVDFID